MGRPRQALWESPDKGVYVTQHSSGAYRVVDTRSTRPKELRQTRDLADAIAVATDAAASMPPNPHEQTFFDLAKEFFLEGRPVLDNGEYAWSAGWTEDLRSHIRLRYEHVGGTPVSRLPRDFIATAAMSVRAEGKSMSLEDKVITAGRHVVNYGKRIGVIDEAASFPGPVQGRSGRKIRNHVGDDDAVAQRSQRRARPVSADHGRWNEAGSVPGLPDATMRCTREVHRASVPREYTAVRT